MFRVHQLTYSITAEREWEKFPKQHFNFHPTWNYIITPLLLFLFYFFPKSPIGDTFVFVFTSLIDSLHSSYTSSKKSWKKKKVYLFSFWLVCSVFTCRLCVNRYVVNKTILFLSFSLTLSLSIYSSFMMTDCYDAKCLNSCCFIWGNKKPCRVVLRWKRYSNIIDWGMKLMRELLSGVHM
jgi:hypothetical protein